MSDYTTRTASLRATKIDTRIVDTKFLKINGETFDPNSGKVQVWNGKWSDGVFEAGAWILEFDNFSIDWMPHKLYINGHEVMCLTQTSAAGWGFGVAEQGDDLSQLYGGITDDTPVTIYYSLR